MTGERLGDAGIHVAARQIGDERVAKRVKIREAAGRIAVHQIVRVRMAALCFGRCRGLIDPDDSRLAEIGPHELSSVFGHSKYGSGQRARQEPAAEALGEFAAERLNVLASALRIRGGDRDRRQRSIEVEGAERETSQLSESQARFHGHEVEHGPIRPGDPRPRDAPVRDGDKPTELVGAQRPPFVPNIQACVSPLKMTDGVFRCAPIANHPAGELLTRPQVIIARLDADRPVAGSATGQIGLDRGGDDVGPAFEIAVSEQGFDAGADPICVVFRVAFGQQECVPVRDVLDKRFGCVLELRVPMSGRTKDAEDRFSDHGRNIERRYAHPGRRLIQHIEKRLKGGLRDSLVGAECDSPALSEEVSEFAVPSAGFLAAPIGMLEDLGHGLDPRN